MKRFYDDEDDYYGCSGSGSKDIRQFELDPTKSRLKFVSGSDASSKQFYGMQEVIRPDITKKPKDERRPLTSDEKNALSAKILKAELSGKMERAQKLKKQLESGYAEDDKVSGDKNSAQILMKMDKKSGLITPAVSAHEALKGSSSSTILNSYEKSATLQELVEEEKKTDAKDHLNMFERAMKMTAANKTTDDYVIDDNVETHKKRRRHADKDERRAQSKQIAEHKQVERTLASCQLCLEKCDKLQIVAIGFKTYLAVVPWKGLDDFHCRILPTDHCISTVNLDEDVLAEMRIWRKGLVAMFAAENEDCVFIETAKVESGKNHMAIECIPLPKESGDLAPIYFKQALEEAGALWSTHKKLFKLSDQKDGSVRSLIPKGFSYFSVDFGLQSGYAHVIEDEDKMPDYFGQEIVGGILDVEHKKWRNLETESKADLKDKRDRFRERWANFDWTEQAKKRVAEE